MHIGTYASFILTLVGACGGTIPESPPPSIPPSAPTSSEAPPPVASDASVTTRTIITLGRKSGTSVLSRSRDGTLRTTLDVLENGRGPHVEATFTLAPDGTLATFQASGHHTMGTTFTSSFWREGELARWQSTEESGQQRLSGPAFFVPLADVAEVAGLLVQAALAHGGRLALLPAGEARVERVKELELSSGSEKRKVYCYTITGIGLTPSYTWMNQDGSWFGTFSEWFSAVPEGWDGVVDTLVAAQRELDRSRASAEHARLAHRPPAAGLAYVHARVLDVERGKWRHDQTVVVVGNEITALGPSKGIKVPAGAEIVDLGGRALIPGLWDMHAHFDEADGALNIASGVTTVRDVGNDPDKLDDYKRRIDGGEAIGPHILRFGFIEGRNEKAAASKVTAETEDEARAAVKVFVDRGYEGVKIYNSVRPELVPIIAKEAHAHGLRVTGHIPVHMLAHEAVRAGYDGIEHINMLFLNFFATHETDTRDTTRFTLVGDMAADFDLNGKQANEFFALLAKRGTVIDPTVNAFEDLLVAEQGKITAGLEGIVSRLPLSVQRGFLLGGLPLGDKQERYRASFDKLLAMIKALVDHKIPTVVGTDALAGLMLHHEMALFARAGIANADILRMATIGAAKSVGLGKKRGSIAVGKVADLVVIDGDPLARIDDIGRVVSTMRAGVTFDASALYQSVSVTPLSAAK